MTGHYLTLTYMNIEEVARDSGYTEDELDQILEAYEKRGIHRVPIPVKARGLFADGRRG